MLLNKAFSSNEVRVTIGRSRLPLPPPVSPSSERGTRQPHSWAREKRERERGSISKEKEDEAESHIRESLLIFRMDTPVVELSRVRRDGAEQRAARKKKLSFDHDYMLPYHRIPSCLDDDNYELSSSQSSRKRESMRQTSRAEWGAPAGTETELPLWGCRQK